MKNFFLAALFIISFTGCKKDLSDHPFTKLNTSVNGTVRSIAALDESTWLISGGDEQSGFIMKTQDAGYTWTTSATSFTLPVSCLYFLNGDTGFAGDSDIIIYRTTNGGVDWNPFHDTSWPLTVNRNLRDIFFIDDSTGFVCGGKNLGNGVLYHTQDGGNDWQFSEYNHEYRGICFADELNGVMCGYGSLLLTNDGGQTFHITNYNSSYFTGICLDIFKQYWICDFNGKVMKSSDKGSSWQETRNGSTFSVGNGQLNCIDVSPSGRIVCAGPNGFLTWSDNQGNSWNDRTSFGGNDILKIKWISNAEVVAVGKNGGVYKLKM